MSRAQGVVQRPSEVLTQVAGKWDSIDETPDYEAANILGTTLGVYRLDAILGSGAVGVVYKAWDTRCNRIVALKLLRAGLLATVDDRRRFRQEALALGRLSHANVTTILDFGSAYGRDYLVMEFVPGQTVSELLDGEPMASDQVAHLGEQLANGLEAAHRAGVIHRDIKPQNLRLTPDGQLKILDFGLARDDTPEPAQDSNEGGIVGTVPYMAPEQLAGARIGPRTDVYGAGAVLYELACGRRPFVADTVESLVNMIRHETPPPPSAINPLIWPSLEAVIVRALAKEPDARIESARALGVALSVVGRRSVIGAFFTDGISDAIVAGHMVKRVQELEVWEWAINLDVAVSATIDAGNFQNHRKLREQITDATDSVLSNIAEGFDQPTDRAFVRYLYISKSANSEVRTRLGSACRKSCISGDQFMYRPS